MTLMLESSMATEMSDDPFNYVPLGRSQESKLRKGKNKTTPTVVTKNERPSKTSSYSTRKSSRIKSASSKSKSKSKDTNECRSFSEKVDSGVRCSDCGMPWTCLKAYESQAMHKGFCSVRLTQPEDRELVPECPEGSKCLNTMAIHYEFRRHEHVNWNATPTKPKHTTRKEVVISNKPSQRPKKTSFQKPLPSPLINKETPKNNKSVFKSPTKDMVLSAKKTRKVKRLFSDMDMPLLHGVTTQESLPKSPIVDPVSSPSKMSWRNVSSVVLPPETNSIHLASTATSHNALADQQYAEDTWNKTQDVEVDSLLSDNVVKDFICNEIERYKVLASPLPPQCHSTPLKPSSSHNKPPLQRDLSLVEEENNVDVNNSFLNHSIYKRFFEEEIQRNKEKTLMTQSAVITPKNTISDEKSDSNESMDDFCSVKSGVKVSAKATPKDGGIHLSLKVTNPELNLQKLKMSIPNILNEKDKAVPTALSNRQTTINDFFGGSSKPARVIASPPKERINPRQNRTYNCPAYKRISNTSFAVDAFNYGYVPGVSIYFLSHFHRDHYIGLTNSFSKPIVCSAITARLLRMQLKIDDSYIRALDLNMEISVDGTGATVTLLEANHCPGAVMFLFRFPDKTAILHTGDFRAIPAMEEYPALWECQIKRLHIDTTYCSSEYDFPAQDYVIKRTVSVAKERLRRDPNTIILVGTYTIGKEKIFLAIAEELDKKIFPSAAQKARILSALDDEVLMKRLIQNRNKPDKSFIHIVSVKDARDVSFLNKYRKKFQSTSILSIVPTGWTREASSFKVNQKGNGVYTLEVPYSEHSSYSELKRFVQFLNLDSADSVIPTVNVGSYASRSRLKKIFQSWIEKEDMPIRNHPASPS